MSTYGGDSWAREAQYRKRRIDDLVIDGVEASAYKKLSSGKFACLVCPNNPVLDTAIMLSTHINGSRHRAAELKRKDRELAMQEEDNKRLALSDCVNPNFPGKASSINERKTTSKPLIDRVRKAASEVFSSELTQPEVKPDCRSNGSSVEIEAANNGAEQLLDHRDRRERELKFTAAGWKRDCHGRWFKDENVEFDSDEEDPNIVLNNTN
ncbi:hypothetical protein BUALT_Bualt15G0034100 [Buddleja alternifolia]|uniref:Sodium channel modifier 1 n=1 Tax=Buddleja alternifolia TaxID=168488 RepID=A0AAV6WLD8_9LAMI|nr:hypothetical protein BUALT_Bualt15G0034100 [Buddleja alternifolia]